MKRAFFLVSVALLSLASIRADEPIVPAEAATMSPIERSVPAPPIVSALSATVTGSQVKLAWVPNPEVDGESVILRHTEPITAANYQAAERVGSVSHVIAEYVDRLPDARSYYYAVLSRDSAGIPYEFFVPVSNSLLIAIAAEGPLPPPERARFSGFDAMTRNEAVIVAYQASVKGKRLVLYRSTSPLVSLASLAQAIVIASFTDSGSPYVDYPVPGVPYYYAIIDEDELLSGSARFVPGENTNRVPVEVPAYFASVSKRGPPPVRPIPLPYLNPSRVASLAPRRFGSRTESMIRKLASARAPKPTQTREPYVFLSDLTVETGEEYALRQVLEGFFRPRDWDGAIAAIGEFLSIRRSERTTARAHFYLGEALFFKGEHGRAILEFLLARDQYYNQSREWIQYALKAATNPI
ncbi:MAG TPA: hypothetical protein PLU93_04240 [Treponemataceae bacterium]|jgi:hypothetical protein|nr:hypothetical protein [Treponemataceae bacterium]